MGDCMSVNRLCCPNDKNYVISEFSSPKNIHTKQDFSALVISKSLSEIKCTSPGPMSEYSGVNRRSSLRRSSCLLSPVKKSFLARAREKSRNGSRFSLISSEYEEFAARKLRSLTYNDEELEYLGKCQSRISIDSPNQNEGDYDDIEFY